MSVILPPRAVAPRRRHSIGPVSLVHSAHTNRKRRFSTFSPKQFRARKEDIPTAPPLLRVAGPELWRMIFSHFSLADNGGTLAEREQLMVLMQVCHQWKEIVQPMLFEGLAPGSFKSLLKLKKTLVAHPHLRNFPKALCAPGLHSRYVSPKGQEWRTRTVSYCSRRKVKIEIAPKDYYELISYFSDVASLCPNIKQLVLPICITANRGANKGFSPQFSFPEHLLANLTHLTLTPLVFPSSSCKFTKLVFPSLLSLFLDGLTMRHTDFIEYFSFPKLKYLILRQLSALSTVFHQFFETIKDTVKVVKFRDPYIINNRPGADLTTPFHDLWFVDSLCTESLLENVHHLSIPGRRESPSIPRPLPIQFHPLVSLKSLSIGQSERSGFAELFILPPSITKLTIAITTSTPKGCFHVSSKLALFVKDQARYAPNLKTMSIMWYLQRASRDPPKEGEEGTELLRSAKHLSLAKALAFCLGARCESQNVKVSIVLERMTENSEHSVKGRELMAPGPHRWTKNPNMPLPTLDRALKKIGIKVK